MAAGVAQLEEEVIRCATLPAPDEQLDDVPALGHLEESAHQRREGG